MNKLLDTLISRRFLSAVFGAVAVCLLSSDSVLAQSTSLFGSSGPAGQIGSNLRGSSVGRSSTLGVTTQNLSTSGFGSGGLSTPGAIGGGTQGVGTGSGTASTFVGRNDSTGRFVGNQAAGNQNPRSTTPNFTSTGQGRTGESFGEVNQNQTGSSGPQFRPQLRIAFDYASFPRPEVSIALQQKFDRLVTRDSRIKSLFINTDSTGKVVLRGEVDSEETRRLAELLTRLEPGVREVDNQLTVTP